MIDFITVSTWRDAVEIFLCITAYYLINSKLYTQESKKLLMGWYGYHALMICAYSADLPTIFFISACCFPVVLMLASMFSQEKLQKMFVVAQRRDPLTTTTSSSTWVDELMKFLLQRLNEQKDLAVIIEYNDSLSELITTSEMVHAALKKNTLELLYSSLMPQRGSFLWITAQGTIMSLNALWKDTHTSAVTHATDCIALTSCVATRTFTVIIGSKIIENLSAHHALNILYEQNITTFKKQVGNHHAHQSTRSRHTDAPFS